MTATAAQLSASQWASSFAGVSDALKVIALEYAEATAPRTMPSEALRDEAVIALASHFLLMAGGETLTSGSPSEGVVVAASFENRSVSLQTSTASTATAYLSELAQTAPGKAYLFLCRLNTRGPAYSRVSTGGYR